VRPKSPSQHERQMSAGVGRLWWIAVSGVALVALVTRVSNAFLLPPLIDYDAFGHGLNAFALYQGHLPDPRSWAGFHPPLYYAVAACLWHLLPPELSVQTALRLLSLAAGAGAVWWTNRVLARRLEPLDAAVVCVVAFCTPVVIIATSMIGNETTCALLVTGTLARLTVPPPRGASAVRHAAWTGVLAGLAALAKATGLIAIATLAIFYAHRLWRQPRQLLATLAAASIAPLLLLGLFYAHLVAASGGSLGAVISGSVTSADNREAMAEQPPGFRTLAHYLSFPSAALLMPYYKAPGLMESVPGLLYTTLQADGLGDFMPASRDRASHSGATLAIAGILPSALALAGFARAIRRPARYGWLAGPSLFAGLLAMAFVYYTVALPRYSAVKASYLLGALLPATSALGIGLEAASPRWRGLLRLLLLLVAVCDVWILWQGRWR
jgi:hypothetical protein